MFEGEVDSEDDFEGYFLQPVNAYNIVDKIKEANKELFSTPQPESPSSSNVPRKVKFRDVLEDYEPIEEEDPCVNEITSLAQEPILEVSSEGEENSTKIEVAPTSVDQESQEEQKEISKPEKMSDTSDQEEIEEICEEISTLEVVEAKQQQPEDEENQQEVVEPVKDSGESNLDSFDVSLPQLRKESTDDSTSYTKTSDDELSVIVASYVVEPRNKKFVDELDKPKSGAGSRSKPVSAKPKKRPAHQRVGDLLRLRLSYKTCCEYKNSIDEQLPRYNGYQTQYGLTKEQWDRREMRIEKGRKRFLEKAIHANDEETKRNEDNEKAFTNWLKNKMRCPINKTKNMFDFKGKSKKQKTKTKT